MTLWLALRTSLTRLVYGSTTNSHSRNGASDVRLVNSVLKHTLRWYAVVGTIAVALTPVLYTTMRALAPRRKTFILQTASSLARPSADVVETVVASPPRPFFLSNARVLVASERILDAQRATDPEFAKAFASEMVKLYIDAAFRGLLRSCCRDCCFHVGVFLTCTALSGFSGLMVNGVSNAGHICCNSAGGSATGFQSLCSAMRELWCHLRHGTLLQHAVDGMDSLYVFFIFSQSSCRMLERWFPWLGVAHFTVARIADPSTYLDGRWRSPEEADRVWRAMTPKGFTVMWCCRSLTPLLRPRIYDACECTHTPSGSSCKSNVTHVVDTACSEHPHGSGRLKCWGLVWTRHMLPALHRLCSFIFYTGKTSALVLLVTTCASSSNLSWLPFPCDGGPRYVALCYAEMILTLWEALALSSTAHGGAFFAPEE